MKVYIETYGCQMNEYDSELVQSILFADGFQEVSDVQEADVVLMNTCAVREHASHRVLARIGEIRHHRTGAPLLIGVLGCMASGLKKKLIEAPNSPIDFLAGPDSYRRLPDLIRQANRKKQQLHDVRLSKIETYEDIYPQRRPGVNAWIAIMRGCNNFCSFCVVPYSRGRERSRSVAGILAETRRLVAEGYPQVTLLGQNVNSYRSQGIDFAGLLEQVSTVTGLRRVRFTSPHPKDFPRALLRVMKEQSIVCKHIHLPLQAGNDRVLSLMRRTYGKQQYLDLAAEIQAALPGVVLTTDVIVGFPTETDAEFADTVEVMETVRFDSAFIFKYSERPGTLAAKKFPDDVSEAVKTQRIVQLNNLQKEISLARHQQRIGSVEMVLIERQGSKKSAEEVQGRTDGNLLVILPAGAGRPGDFIQARITEATPHVLKGVVEPSTA